MMSEMDIFNATRDYLENIKADTFQLVPPGGQAPYSITFDDGGRRRTCFPDIIAISMKNLIVGEMKPRFSAADYAKVLTMISLGEVALLSLVRRLSKSSAVDLKVTGLLCHGSISAKPLESVEQWIFKENRFHVSIAMAVPL